MGNESSSSPMEVVRPGDLIPDSRLASTDQDLLDHDAIARGVAEIAVAAQRDPKGTR